MDIPPLAIYELFDISGEQILNIPTFFLILQDERRQRT